VISEKIKQLRLKHGLTQTEMSKLLGCSAAMVSAYESGKTRVSYDVVNVYVKRFGCPAEYIMNEGLPLMDEPETLEKSPYTSKMPVLKNLALPCEGNNVWKRIPHPFYDVPAFRKGWITKNKEGKDCIVLYVEAANFREGDHVIMVLEGKTTTLGYYYVDENRNICIKSKPKGEKGNRNIRIGLEKGDKIIGIVEHTINED